MRNWFLTLVFLSFPAFGVDGLIAVKSGTPFMECGQTVGIDLPLKALVWQDESGQVWLGYNDPAYLAVRHGVAQCPAVEGLRKALAVFVQQATLK